MDEQKRTKTERLMPKNVKIFLMVLVLFIVCASIFIYTTHSAFAAPAPTPSPELEFWEKINPINLIPLALGFIVQLLISLVGGLLSTTVLLLTKYILFYNEFIYTSIVMTGWEIVRDMANMFFVLILLFVAIATILSIENYSLRRFLPRIVLMAVLINFSKVIAGLIIDVSQIVTWTFASVIQTTATQNIFMMFGIPDLFAYTQVASPSAIREWQIVGGLILGFILLLIAFIVILVYTIIFTFRIVALWILIILSPLAYLLSAWPGGYLQRYAHQWWEEFTKYVIVGPVLMFFLWLALTASSVDIQLNVPSGDTFAANSIITRIAEPKNLIRFIVTACLLIAGLSAAQRSGVAGSKYAGAAMSRMRRTAQWAGRKFTGYGFAADRVKAYMDIRKARKRESVISGARAIEKGVAWTQRAAKTAVSAPFKGVGSIPLGKGRTVGTAVTAAWDHTGNYFGGRAKTMKQRAENYKKTAQKYRDEANDLQKKEVPKIPQVKLADSNPEYKKLHDRREQLRKEIEDVEKNKGMSGVKKAEVLAIKKGQLSDIETNIKPFEQEENLRNEAVKTKNEKAIEDRDKEVQSKLHKAESADIHAGEAAKRAEGYTKTQRRVNKAIHIGVGGVLGAGLPYVGVPLGAALGGFGVSKVVKNIKEAGKGDGESVKNYEAGQVTEERSKIKDLSNHEVIAKLDDPTSDKYQRAALAMEALSRKLISGLSEVKSRRDRLGEDFKGNNRILSQMESVLERNYPGATRDFADASIDLEEVKKKHAEGTPEYEKEKEKKERAQRNLRDEYNQGDRSIRDTDRATLEKTPDLWAPGIKTSAFVRQYDGLEDEQKKNIIKSSLDEYIEKLKKLLRELPAGHKDREKHETELQQAREKYAGITNVEKAYGKISAVPANEEEKTAKKQRDKYVSSLNVEQIRKILREGEKDKITALVDAVNKKEENLSEAVRRAVDAWGGTGKEIAKALHLEGVGKSKPEKESETEEEEEEETT